MGNFIFVIGMLVLLNGNFLCAMEDKDKRKIGFICCLISNFILISYQLFFVLYSHIIWIFVLNIAINIKGIISNRK